MKIEEIIVKYPTINVEHLKESLPPWEVTEEDACKIYTKFVKDMELDDPDSELSMKRLKNSMIYIYKFCEHLKLSFDDYMEYTIDSLPCWVEHLKNHNITFYSLHALTFKKPMVDSELLEFVIPNFFLVFQKTKNKFYTSNKMKEFSKLAKENMDSRLNKVLLVR